MFNDYSDIPIAPCFEGKPEEELRLLRTQYRLTREHLIAMQLNLGLTPSESHNVDLALVASYYLKKLVDAVNKPQTEPPDRSSETEVRWYATEYPDQCYEVRDGKVKLWNSERWVDSGVTAAELAAYAAKGGYNDRKLHERDARRIIGKGWRGDRWFTPRGDKSGPYVRMTSDGRVFLVSTGAEQVIWRNKSDDHVINGYWFECDSHGTPLAEATAPTEGVRYYTSLRGVYAYLETDAAGADTLRGAAERLLKLIDDDAFISNGPDDACTFIEDTAECKALRDALAASKGEGAVADLADAIQDVLDSAADDGKGHAVLSWGKLNRLKAANGGGQC